MACAPPRCSYWRLLQRQRFRSSAAAAPPVPPSKRGIMRTCKVVRTLVQTAFLGTLATGFAVAQTPQMGNITGRVTDAASGQPVSAAQVGIVGTNVGAQATTEGVFTLRGVNPGTVQIRVLRVGYAEVKQTVTVTGG